jgi:hypothetical protein
MPGGTEVPERWREEFDLTSRLLVEAGVSFEAV